MPKRAADDGGRGIGRASSRANVSGSSRSRPSAVADRLLGSGTAMSELRSRRASASSRSSSASQSRDPGGLDHVEAVRRRRRRRPRGPAGAASIRSAASRPMPVVGQGRDGSTAAYGLGSPFCGLSSQPSTGSPHARELVAHGLLVGRRAERRRARAPEVGRDRQVVGGAGEGDVAEPQLLLGVVGAGVRRGRRRGRPCPSPAAAAGRGRRRAAAPGGSTATRSTACATGWTGSGSRRRRPGRPSPTRGPWSGARSAA